MRIKIESFYLFYFAATVVCTNYTYAARSSYGEECNRTQKCDRLAWLSCQEGICDCSKSDEMLYDDERKACVIKSGERCKYGVEESGEISLLEFIDCVTHANCSSVGLCECDSRYYETFNGTCGLSLTIGENCSDGNECSKYENLVCVNGQCRCKVGEAQYSAKEGHCVGLDQNDCIRGKCVEGASCNNNETCQCSYNYFASSDHICNPKKEIFQNCTRDEECLNNDHLKPRCISGICDCPTKSKYSRVQKYEYEPDRRVNYNNGYLPIVRGFKGPTVEICAPLIGEYCPDGYCMENAICTVPKRQNNYKGWMYSSAKCVCSGSLFPSWNRTRCANIYGRLCESEADCTDDFVCSNDKCDCPSPKYQYFNSTTKTCMTKIGGHCTKDSVCIENSHCEFPSAKTTSGHCRCNENFVMNKQRTCDLNYGKKCSIKTAGCDKAAGLLCLNNKCSCPDIMYSYSQTLRTCLGLVGANCNSFQGSDNIFAKNPDDNMTLTNPKLLCVSNAYCYKSHILLPAECKCKDGYAETDSHTCQFVLGGIDEPSSVNQESSTDHRDHSLRGIGNHFNSLLGSKELPCNSSEFRCAKSRHCVSKESRCDGKKDCYDGSDEEDCDNYCFQSNLFRCRNGKCIVAQYVCDGEIQCAIDNDGDRSDEMDCGSFLTTTPRTNRDCNSGYGWVCLSGECIPKIMLCDGISHCRDQSDEPEGCENAYVCNPEFRCFSGGDCIRRDLICNGMYDCYDGSDESVCSNYEH